LSGQWIFIVSSTDTLSTIMSFEELKVYSACSDCHSNSNSPAGTMSSSACTCSSRFTNTTRENRRTCTGCAAGKYKTLEVNSLCTDRLPGQYSTEENSITNQCINCTQHSTSLAGSQDSTCCVCNMGFSGVDGAVCSICDIGKFSHRGPHVFEGYQFLCTGSIDWARDHFTALVETQGSTLFFYTGRGSFCLAAAGSINNSCLPDMSYAEANLHQDSVTESFCDSSLANQICVRDSTPNAVEWKNCPPNKNSSEGARSESDCMCVLGFIPTITGECEACSIGKFGVLGGCADCPTNSYSSPGSIILTDCKCNTGFSNEAANTCVRSEMAIMACLKTHVLGMELPVAYKKSR